MAVVWTLARAGVRHRPRGLLGFVVIVALGLGVSLAAFEIARRTEDAFPTYLEQANVGALLVNPNLSDARAAELIATTPGVTGYATDDLLTAGIDPGRPITQAEVDRIGTVVLMSPDGRYIEQDRPVVEQGRMLDADGPEVFLNRAAAEELGLDVGAEITLAFYRPSFTIGVNAPEFGPSQDDVVEPIGRSTARVVGIGTLATDVLPDDLYPQSVMLISPEVGEQFTCTFDPFDADPELTIEEHLLATFPADCALNYRYFSLQIPGGDDAAASVADELVARGEAENERLPAVVRESIGYFFAPTATSDERDRVIDSVRPPAAALRLFAVVAGLATLVLALLSALRIARREQANQVILRQLGVTRRERSLALLAPLAASAALGLIGAVAVGLAGSGLGAVASVQVLEPETRFALDGSVLALVATGGVALLAGLTAIAWMSARSRDAPPVERPSALLRLTGALPPARRLGMQAATRGLSAATVGIGSITAVLAVVASLVFATNVNALVDTPARYGWPYDLAVIIGYGYGESDVDAIAESLDRAEVERWGLAALETVTIDGESLPAVAERTQFGELNLPVIEGRRPSGPGEIALGRASAAKLDLEVGDTVSVVTPYGKAAATVTGLVVLPPVGSYLSSRAASGTGVLLSEPLFADVLARGEEAQGLPPGSFDDIDLGAFLALDLADGVDVNEFLASIDADERRSWHRDGFEPSVYPNPVRPAAIADVASIRRLPIGLGGLFALAMAVGLATGIAVATRARRRELAILGALGCTPRQLAASVRWHALTVAAIALLVGVPLGVAAGRVLYRNFAVDLGVLPTVATSLPALAGVAIGTIIVGFLASALPAHRVSSTRVAFSLREE